MGPVVLRAGWRFSLFAFLLVLFGELLWLVLDSRELAKDFRAVFRIAATSSQLHIEKLLKNFFELGSARNAQSVELPAGSACRRGRHFWM